MSESAAGDAARLPTEYRFDHTTPERNLPSPIPPENDMDIAPLAADLATLLAPLVPLLAQGGEKAAEALGEKLG